jgi:outer membrane PBP1 activator LpoA protein
VPPPAVTVKVTPSVIGPLLPLAPLPALQGSGSIALILPLSGPLSLPARAVRDGFLAAYYEMPEPRPKVQVYDSGSGADDAFAVYEKAIEGGADFVVGPLAKEAVATLARMTTPRTPILALNYLDAGENAPDRFYQFGLAPEDEAQQVAERAFGKGYRKAIALVPEGDWGSRTLAAFRQRFESLGGTLQGSETFGAKSPDYAQSVSRLLKIAPAPADKPDAQPSFAPSPGNDPDFVFIAAQPQQARQIRPQFSFFGAGRLPMFATSHLYEGFASSSRDGDLDGIEFCDMPWVLGTGEVAGERDRVRALWPDSYTRYPRLYAFGYDAARLLAAISSGHGGTNDYAAATGRLHIDAQGRVHRGLIWARFEGGAPRVLDGP